MKQHPEYSSRDVFWVQRSCRAGVLSEEGVEDVGVSLEGGQWFQQKDEEHGGMKWRPGAREQLGTVKGLCLNSHVGKAVVNLSRSLIYRTRSQLCPKFLLTVIQCIYF